MKSDIIEKEIETMSKFIEPDCNGWTRRAFTNAYQQGRNYLKELMTEIGMKVHYDAAANLVGTIDGSDKELVPIILGSHSDTVLDAGKYDGVAGLISAIEVIRLIKQKGITPKRTIKVVDFTLEEANEFGVPPVGSSALAGMLTTEMLNKCNLNGLTLRDCIKNFGGSPDEIEKITLKKGDVYQYLELHIEQGPVLYNKHKHLGVVTGIVGINRYRVIIKGQANHAGTTPMTMRSDALLTFSKLCINFNKACNFFNAIGTIGKIEVKPNFSNIIAGEVIFEIDIRSLDKDSITGAMVCFREHVRKMCEDSDIDVDIEKLSTCKSVQIEERVQNIIKTACEGVSDTILLPSGAGHDGNEIGLIAPIGMIFIPSYKGLSHCPEEYTSINDIVVGIEALFETVINIEE